MKLGFHRAERAWGNGDGIPWTHDEWLAYLDGWTFAALGLDRPVERRGKHADIYRFGENEYHRAKKIKESIAEEETTQ